MLLVSLFCLAMSSVVPVGGLPPPDRPYNVLMMLPVGFTSHRNVFRPLATALADRGHNVTMLNNLPAPDNNPNITYINHGLPPLIMTNIFENSDIFEILANTSKYFDDLSKNYYDVPIIRELYEKREYFDVVIFDHIFAEIGYPFADVIPFMTITTIGVDSQQSAAMGNFLNPAYMSNMFSDLIHPFTFFERINNIVFSAMLPYHWRFISPVPQAQGEISKRFPHLPPLLEIEKNISMTLLNDNFVTRPPFPVLPNQVEVGGIHCRAGEPLPEVIEKFLGDDPAIFFSLGTISAGTFVPTKYQKIFVETFAILPYKILWKYEGKRNDTSKNVFLQKWMPQQDILAHPNVKLFISHCGLLSSIEALYHATPILGLPVFGDQPKNANKLKSQGVAQFLKWEELTVESLRDAIEEMIKNPSYQRQVSAISIRFKDQPMSPVDKAVYWTEYVIRHKGARHLRSPELDLSWVQLLHLDIIFMMHILLFVCYKVFKIVFRICFGVKKCSTKNKTE